MNLFWNLLTPAKCISCGKLFPWDAPGILCDACAKRYADEKRERCGYCGSFVSDCRCAPDLMKRAGCKILLKAVYYRPGVRDLPQNRILYHIKRSGNRKLSGFLCRELEPKIRTCLLSEKATPEDAVICFAPRSFIARAINGVDQAQILCNALAKAAGIRSVMAFRRKEIFGKSQKALSFADRKWHAEKIYEIRKGLDFSGKTVFLTDDTVTTGSTMAACAKRLKEAGASRVIGVSFTFNALGQNPPEVKISTAVYR